MSLESASVDRQNQPDPRVVVLQSAEASSIDKEIAFTQIVFEYQPMLLEYIRGFTDSAETAHDIVQDTFLNAWRTIENFRGQSSLSTWLYTIAHNRALDVQYAKVRKPEILTSPEDALSPILQMPDRSPSPEEALLSKELIGEVAISLAQLTSSRRNTLALSLIGFKNSEIAEMRQIQKSTVTRDLSLAKKQTRITLSEEN